ncbi:hypothetical protein XU18_3568 [Perkinsela sp. CCAP 1560/4]|nr:hypothetical protein XU18_3568 [Perkinsela sp. CCAP 1560/4]|eukprot:KNH05397.1 hypothetical protein XU18_3568 [Perkinsela sp. CCAP 1560/4]
MGAVSASQTAAKLNWVSARLCEEQQWLSALQMLREHTHTLQEYSAHSMQRKRRWRSNSSILFSPFVLSVLQAVLPQIIERNHAKLWEALKRTVSQTPALGEFVDARSLSWALEKCVDESPLTMLSFCGCVHSDGMPHSHGPRAFQRCGCCGRIQVVRENISPSTHGASHIAAAQAKMQNITKEKYKLSDLYCKINGQIREMDECLKTHTAVSWVESLYLASCERDIRHNYGKLLINSEKISALYKKIPALRLLENSGKSQWRRSLEASIHSILSLSHAARAEGQRLHTTESRQIKAIITNRLSTLHKQRSEIQHRTQLLDEEKKSFQKKIQTSSSQCALDIVRRQKQRIEFGVESCGRGTTASTTRRYYQTYDYGIIKVYSHESRKGASPAGSALPEPTQYGPNADGHLLEEVVQWIESRVEKETRYRKALPYQTIYPPVVFRSMGLSYPSVYPFNVIFDEKSRKNNMKVLNHFCVFDRCNIYLTKVFPLTKHWSALNNFLYNTNQWEAALAHTRKCFKRHASPIALASDGENNHCDTGKHPAKLLAPLLHDCPRYSLRVVPSPHRSGTAASTVFKQIEVLGMCRHALTIHHLVNAMRLLRSSDMRHTSDVVDALRRLFLPFASHSHFEEKTAFDGMCALFRHITTGQFSRGLLAIEVLHLLKSSWESSLCFFRNCLGSTVSPSENNQTGHLSTPLYISAVLCLKNTLRRHCRWDVLLKLDGDLPRPASRVRKVKSKRAPKGKTPAETQRPIDPMLSHENMLSLHQKLASLRTAKILMAERHSKRADLLVDPCNNFDRRRYKGRAAHLRHNLWANGLACSSFVFRYMKLQPSLVEPQAGYV